MEEVKKVYSVWGVPSPDIQPRIRNIMDVLCTDFNAPYFDPHVTVVGAIELTEHEAVTKFHEACNGVKAYKAVVEKVTSGTFFFQCVFLLLEPTAEVVDTSSHVCGHFGYKSSTPYMPHLSLLYQDLIEDEKKSAVDKVNSLDEGICSLSFQISSLALYEIEMEDKTLKSWKKIAECSLETN